MGRTGLLDSGREGHLHPLTLFALTLLALIQAFLANQLVYALVLALSFLVLLDVSPASFLRQLALFAVACGVVQLILHVDIGYVTSIFLGVAVRRDGRSREGDKARDAGSRAAPEPASSRARLRALLRSPCVQVPARERDARLLRDFERNRSELRKDELPKSLLRSA